MHAFVTGAGGLIGSNLVRELCARGLAVRAMVRDAGCAGARIDARAEICVGDLFDAPQEMANRMRGCELVFHAAAYFAYAGVDEAQLQRTAGEGTRNVLAAAAAAGVQRVVVTSSSVVFGSSPSPAARDETCAPDPGFAEPPYVRSKILQSELALAQAAELGLEVVLACPTMSLGYPAAALGPSNAIVVSYLSDPLRMTYPGGCNLVSVRDVAHGHWLVATRGRPGESYLLGSENLSWRKIHGLIAELCGTDGPRAEVGHAVAYLGASYEELRATVAKRAPITTRAQARMIGRYYWYSHAKAAALGYAPRPARTALAEACACLAASRHVSRETRAGLRLHPEVHAARASAGAAWS